MSPELLKLLVREYAEQRWAIIDPVQIDEDTNGMSLSEAIEEIDRRALDYGLLDPLEPWVSSDRHVREVRISALRAVASAYPSRT
jgi:hypothetical protein